MDFLLTFPHSIKKNQTKRTVPFVRKNENRTKRTVPFVRKTRLPNTKNKEKIKRESCCVDSLFNSLGSSKDSCLFELAVAVGCIVSELLLDAEQLVVLGHAVGAAERTGLDLSAVGGNCDVGDGSVLGLTAAV